MTAVEAGPVTVVVVGPIRAPGGGLLRQPLPDAVEELAACRGQRAELWFPDTKQALVPGRAWCAACEVRAECLLYAIEANEQFGMWGGAAPKQRRPMRKLLVRGQRLALVGAIRRHFDALDQGYLPGPSGTPAELNHGDPAASRMGCRCDRCQVGLHSPRSAVVTELPSRHG